MKELSRKLGTNIFIWIGLIYIGAIEVSAIQYVGTTPEPRPAPLWLPVLVLLMFGVLFLIGFAAGKYYQESD